MAVFWAGAGWAALIGWLIWRAVRQSVAHRIGSLTGPVLAATQPAVDVAVIVPARNEIANIGECLACLSHQQGLNVVAAILVVDDGSRDGTADAVLLAARDDARIRLIDAGELPVGWLGKPHACWRGAAATAVEWLCFIDADVRAAPDLLAAAVETAEHQRLDMLSLSPLQRLGSFWERLIVPAGLVLIACACDLMPINDPASSEVSANGQFILIRRSAYFAVGGHAAVRGEICEDKALAAGVKIGGGRYRMLGAESLAWTRMYTDLASLWEGFAKNATEFLGNSSATVGAAAAAAMLAWSALLLPVLAAEIVLWAPSVGNIAGLVLMLSGSLAALGIQIGTARHFRVPVIFGLLFPLAYTVIFALACHSAMLRRSGRVTWKGRTYNFGRQA